MRRTARLMARTEVPVLVVPDTRKNTHPPNGMIRFLIADDLAPSSLPAIKVVTDLVALGIRGDVLHLHVAPTPSAGHTADVDRSWEIWPGISIEDRLYNDHHEHLLDRLHARAEPLRSKLMARRGRYAAELWQGNVREEISRAAAIHQPDLTVFGRHHFLKRQPFSLGQMPFQSMLGLDSAVLVAPDRSLYS
jgi:nucleotide-binding universal stress UspA family protein